MSEELLHMEVRTEEDVALARQRALHAAAALGFERLEQTRIATAVCEIVRNALQHAGGGRVAFEVDRAPEPLLRVRVSDEGPGSAEALEGSVRSYTGMGLGVLRARRLMDSFDIRSQGPGTVVTFERELPRTLPVPTCEAVAALGRALRAEAAAAPLERIRQHNRELARALDELAAREEELARLREEQGGQPVAAGRR